jgi:fumarate hydratase class II
MMSLSLWWNARHYELNVFKPVMAANFLQSARLLEMLVCRLTNIVLIEPNYKRIKELVDNLMLVTALKLKLIQIGRNCSTAQKTEQLLKKRPFV